MKTYDINRCVKCGGIAEIKGRKKIRVICKNCGAQGDVKHFTSQAVDEWNKKNEKKECLNV